MPHDKAVSMPQLHVQAALMGPATESNTSANLGDAQVALSVTEANGFPALNLEYSNFKLGLHNPSGQDISEIILVAQYSSLALPGTYKLILEWAVPLSWTTHRQAPSVSAALANTAKLSLKPEPNLKLRKVDPHDGPTPVHDVTNKWSGPYSGVYTLIVAAHRGTSPASDQGQTIFAFPVTHV